MTNTNNNEMKFAQQLKSNWMILIAIVGLISTWTMFSARLVAAEQKIQQLSEVVAHINQINIEIAKIQKDVEFIRIKIE